MTMTMGMEMSQEPEMSQDPVADAILMDHDDPERLPAIIEANRQQRQDILDAIRESQDRFLGFFEEHMQKLMAYEEHRFDIIHHEHEALKAHFDKIYDETVGYVQALATNADVAVRELALANDERLRSLEVRIARIEHIVDKAGS